MQKTKLIHDTCATTQKDDVYRLFPTTKNHVPVARCIFLINYYRWGRENATEERYCVVVVERKTKGMHIKRVAKLVRSGRTKERRK